MAACDVGRGWLAAEVFGPLDGVPVLLIAGGGGSMSTWLRLLPELHPLSSDELRIVAPSCRPLSVDLRVAVFDQAGVGGSVDVQPATDVGEAARDALAVGRALLGERFVVAGISLGGAVAMMVAHLAPEAVSGLLLACAFAGLSTFVAPPPEDETEDRPGDADGADRSLGETVRVGSAELVDLFMRINDVPLHPGLEHAAIGLFLSHDGLNLGEIAAPTVVLCGEDDQVFPLANSALIASSVPSSRFVSLPATGHALHLEAPEAIAAGLRDLATSW